MFGRQGESKSRVEELDGRAMSHVRLYTGEEQTLEHRVDRKHLAALRAQVDAVGWSAVKASQDVPLPKEAPYPDQMWTTVTVFTPTGEVVIRDINSLEGEVAELVRELSGLHAAGLY